MSDFEVGKFYRVYVSNGLSGNGQQQVIKGVLVKESSSYIFLKGIQEGAEECLINKNYIKGAVIVEPSEMNEGEEK